MRSPVRVLTLVLLLAAVPAAASAATVAAGEAQSCAITGGALKCWGSDSTGGALGTGVKRSDDTAVALPVAGLGSGVTDVSLTFTGGGTNTTGCAVVSGAARCWGSNRQGQLGNGTTTPSNAPVGVSGLDSGVTRISVSTSHVCAVQNGAARCWGEGGGGVGREDGKGSLVPVTPKGLDSGVTDVAAGWRHGCAIRNGAILCWGANGSGQLGYGGPYSTGYTYVPRPMASPPPGTAVRIVAGIDRTCALMASGAVYCWGSNSAGALGAGSTASSSTTPLLVSGLDSGVTDIAGNSRHVCAIRAGSVLCWGDAQAGKLGNGATEASAPDSNVPVAVSGLNGVTSIATGTSHTCAAAADGTWCWGANDHLQLGTDQVRSFSGVPVRASGAAPVVATITTHAKPVRLSASRRTTLATVACPEGATCAVAAPPSVKVRIRSRSFAVAVRGAGAIAGGAKRTLRVTLTRAAVKRLGRRTATVAVRLTTTIDGTAIERTIRVRVRRR